MVEMSNKVIAGIVTLLVLLSSGTTLFIENLGEKTSCKNGWTLMEVGEHEGEYVCYTKTSEPRYELCYRIYDSSNTENYWCEKGKIVETKESIENPPVLVKSNGREYQCQPSENREVNAYTP